MNYGLRIDAIQEQDFIFGDGKLGDAPINPSANWVGWLPDIKVQDKNGIEPYCCVTEATENVVKTLQLQEYGTRDDLSVRFLAGVSGTAAQRGNSLQAVAQTLKNTGCCEERDLPFDSTITTFEKFYAPIAKNLYILALAFTAEFDFGHSYVTGGADALMEALKYSPLAITTYAWVHDPNGIFYRPNGAQDNHCVMLFNFKKGEYWEIFDSYLNRNDDGTYTSSSIKRIRWDCLPQQAKRFTLHRQIVNETAWTKFIKLFRSFFGV